MFIGSHETAQRVLRSGFKGAYRLLTRQKAPIKLELTFGGPGSGCHGPNCGRPEGAHALAPKVKRQTSAAVMKRYGWRRIGHVHDLPHWKKGMGPSGGHAGTIYRHWKYGTIVVNHSGGFVHKDNFGNILSKGSGLGGYARVGKEAKLLEAYLAGVHNKPLENRPAVAETKPVAAVPKFDKTVPPPRDRDIEEFLSVSPVISSKRLGGGVNETKVITFENGSKANFKIDNGSTHGRMVQSGKDNEREVAAWRIAKLVGMDDMVPPSIIRTIDGRKGALLQWQSGSVASDYSGDKYDGLEDRKRAAAFDFVIGNTDRHSNNWVMSPEGKIKLIDNGLAFTSSRHELRSNFVTKLAMDEDWGTPGKQGYPKDYAAPYVAALPKIKEVMDGLGLTGYEQLESRVHKMSTATKWRDLQND